MCIYNVHANLQVQVQTDVIIDLSIVNLTNSDHTPKQNMPLKQPEMKLLLSFMNIICVLPLLKYLTKYELREQLAETLIFLSKLVYADQVFYPLPQFLLCHLQRIQFAAASFVLGHYVKNFRDVLKIGWLPINERRDLNLLKSCFKALHNTETWPDYLKIIKQEYNAATNCMQAIQLD